MITKADGRVAAPISRPPSNEQSARADAIREIKNEGATGLGLALASVAMAYVTKEVWTATFGLTSLLALPPAILTFAAGAFGIESIEVALRGAMRLPPRQGAPLDDAE